jgi:hypothetical protein
MTPQEHKRAVLLEMIIDIGLIVILLFLCNELNAQQKQGYWWKQAGAATCYLVAGFADGQAEIIRNDWRRYQAVHPRSNPQWSNPKLSFRNKYEAWPEDQSAAYPGSKTWLAFTTDKFHLNRTLRNALMAGGLAVSLSLYDKPNWKQILLQAAGSWGCFALGSGVAHAIYKPVN